MKTLSTLALLSFALAIAPFAAAQTHGMSQPAADNADAAMSEGEVKNVDKGAGKLTIKHGELKNLGMPPMTMIFQVKDKAALEQVKPGDHVRFVAAKENGKLSIVRFTRTR